MKTPDPHDGGLWLAVCSEPWSDLKFSMADGIGDVFERARYSTRNVRLVGWVKPDAFDGSQWENRNYIAFDDLEISGTYSTLAVSNLMAALYRDGKLPDSVLEYLTVEATDAES